MMYRIWNSISSGAVIPLRFSSCDAPENWQMSFQDPATPIMEGIINLHDEVMYFICIIVVFVVWVMVRIMYLFSSPSNKCGSLYVSTPEKIVHGSTIEIAWTIAPSLVLVFIAIPSFSLLYSMDEIVDPSVTVKVQGHQWYWSYEYSDYESASGELGELVFDSYMIPDDSLSKGELRLLDVDNRVVLPVNTHVRLIISSSDVLHSWAVPSLGVKCDAIPGRLNQVSVYMKREGCFYGQCSELCGTNHGFMPIVVESVSLEDYVNWVASKCINT